MGMHVTDGLGKTGNGEKATLGDVCVLGLGKTGEAVASYLANLIGTRVTSVTPVWRRQVQGD